MPLLLVMFFCCCFVPIKKNRSKTGPTINRPQCPSDARPTKVAFVSPYRLVQYYCGAHDYMRRRTNDDGAVYLVSVGLGWFLVILLKLTATTVRSRISSYAFISSTNADKLTAVTITLLARVPTYRHAVRTWDLS